MLDFRRATVFFWDTAPESKKWLYFLNVSGGSPKTWAQFCCKMWGGTLVWNQYSHRVDAEVTFYIYRFPVLFLEVFWEQHKSRFDLADYLHVNIPKFVAGHGTVIQPASIYIVFGCKQAQQYSRTHQWGWHLDWQSKRSVVWALLLCVHEMRVFKHR